MPFLTSLLPVFTTHNAYAELFQLSPLLCSDTNTHYLSPQTTQHLTHDITSLTHFTNFQKLKYIRFRILINEMWCENTYIALGSGVLSIRTADGDMKLSNVWFVPDLKMNLISMRRLGRDGLGVRFVKSLVIVEVRTTGEVVGCGWWERMSVRLHKEGDKRTDDVLEEVQRMGEIDI